MKKVFFIVAAATLFFSCAKEMELVSEDTASSGFTFKASIENLATKADMDESYGLLWAENDKIGIGVTGWDYCQPFTLNSAAGSAQGDFEWDFYPGSEGDLDKIKADAYAAFFPWQGQGGSYNSAWKGKVYFKMQGSYGNTSDLDNTPYTSGKMLTPLVGAVSNESIAFKHAGAAVKVTINNLPAGSHSIGMSADQQLYGNYLINVADAGTAAMVLDGDADLSKNEVWLNYAASDVERTFTFIFPTPALTTPKLSFQIWDENGIQVWSKNLKAQTVSPGRGQILEMPATDITPYAQFNVASENWVIQGNLTTDNSWSDVAVVTDGTTCIAKGLSFPAYGEFKIKHPGSDWTGSWPTNNYAINNEEAGTYDIIFNESGDFEGKVKVVLSKCPYPTAEYAEANHHTSIKNAVDLGATETANCYVITAPGKYKIPAVRGNSSTSVGTMAKTKLLWETYNNGNEVTANSVIAAVDWDVDDDYVYFKTPETLKPGNAGIAALDADGNILWSWHIWIPESALTDVGDKSVSKMYYMDRNLGALVATQATNATVNVQSFGMLYQWGRKDPFPGARGFNNSNRAKTEGVFRFDQEQGRTEDTSFDLAASYAHPMVFAKNNAWRTGVTEWNPDGVKSIDDPCPAGYKVPEYDSSDLLWKYVNSASGFEASSTYGWWKVGQFVFPLCGYCESGSSMSLAFDRTRLFSGTMIDYDNNVEYAYGQYLYESSGSWVHDGSTRKRYASSVRCVKVDGQIPYAPASNINLDGDMDDWADGEAIAGDGSYIKEWKFAYDEDNIYFYFKIPTSKITFDTNEYDGETPNPYYRSYRLKRYIYIALDTDNDETKGANPGSSSGQYSYGGLTMNGCDALALVYPFAGTAPGTDAAPSGLEFVDGVDSEGWTRAPASGSRTGKHATVYGTIDGSYAFLEVGLPMNGIGSPSPSKMRIQFSFNWNLAGIYTIEVK